MKYLGNIVCGLTLVMALISCARPPQPDQIVRVVPEYHLGMKKVGETWRIERTRPDFLVQELAEHLGHEMEKGNARITPDQLLGKAEERLKANELFIFNPVSEAHLMIDFSPLRGGETKPSRNAIASSADLAGQSLTAEEGVGDVQYEVIRFELPGAEYAYRLNADYLLHGEKTRFIGIVGFAAPYWLYFYFTDPGKDPGDYPNMEVILNSLTLIPNGTR